MTSPISQGSAVVAIPAHNEATSVARCLSSVAGAAAYAQLQGIVDTVRVVLVAHRCADDTYERARRLSTEHLGCPPKTDVLRLDDEVDVGAVRHAAVRAGLDELTSSEERTWIFSTDADTVVDEDWMARGLGEAAQRSAAAVLGMVRLDAWRGSEAARHRYDRIIAQGLSIDQTGMPSHRHVYGANLLVRADAYAAVGGFPRSGHGEDQRLVDALVNAGHRVVRSRRWTVSTSGRLVGRARGGLADLLHRLDDLPGAEELDAPAAG